jgi:hypothetical protein
MTVPLRVEDKNLYISEETWNDLKAGHNSVAYSSVKALATNTVGRDGAFIIHRDHEDDTSVLNSFHRPSELKEFFDAVDRQRTSLGL